jgi:Flp pilus assembly pilin Flp
MRPAPARRRRRRNSGEAPDFGRAVNRFIKDEDGQSMVEFVIVMPLFLFLVLAIIQFMLIANAAYFVNYANFMAMRTAVAHYEMSTVGKVMPSGKVNKKIPAKVKTEANNTLRYCLLPIAYFPGDKFNSLAWLCLARFKMKLAPKTQLQGQPDPTGAADFIHGHTKYEYPMMIPLAKNVIHAIFNPKPFFMPKDALFYDEILPYNLGGGPFGLKLPGFLGYHRLPILSDSGNPGTAGKNSKQFKNKNNIKKAGVPHRMFIHRRW